MGFARQPETVLSDWRSNVPFYRVPCTSSSWWRTNAYKYSIWIDYSHCRTSELLSCPPAWQLSNQAVYYTVIYCAHSLHDGQLRPLNYNGTNLKPLKHMLQTTTTQTLDCHVVSTLFYIVTGRYLIQGHSRTHLRK